MEHATPESKKLNWYLTRRKVHLLVLQVIHLPSRHDAAVITYSDGMAVQKLIERLHKHPDVIEWEDDSILVKTIKGLLSVVRSSLAWEVSLEI